jgi:hypothetical protein
MNTHSNLMRSRLLAVLAAAIGLVGSLRAQDGPQPGSLDQLLGPVALYPDPLIALILPASALPSDVVAAANYLQSGGDPGQIAYQGWDESVKGLAHYPQVVEWMAQNLGWTQSVGAAFANEPGAVLQAVQQLRAEARASGALVDTPQQRVVLDDGGQIEILPAQAEAIYVPVYDPAIVYVSGRYDFGSTSYITYGAPYPVGAWLSFGFDWRGGSVWVGDWHSWHDGGGWRRAEFVGGYGAGGMHRWGFPEDRPRPQFGFNAQARWQHAAPAPMRAMPDARPYAGSGQLRSNPGTLHAAVIEGRPSGAFRGPEKAGPGKPVAGKKASHEKGSENKDRDKGH